MQTIYQDAVINEKPTEELNKILEQIKQIESLIEERKFIIGREQSSN